MTEKTERPRRRKPPALPPLSSRKTCHFPSEIRGIRERHPFNETGILFRTEKEILLFLTFLNLQKTLPPPARRINVHASFLFLHLSPPSLAGKAGPPPLAPGKNTLLLPPSFPDSGLPLPSLGKFSFSEILRFESPLFPDLLREERESPPFPSYTASSRFVLTRLLPFLRKNKKRFTPYEISLILKGINTARLRNRLGRLLPQPGFLHAWIFEDIYALVRKLIPLLQPPPRFFFLFTPRNKAPS